MVHHLHYQLPMPPCPACYYNTKSNARGSWYSLLLCLQLSSHVLAKAWLAWRGMVCMAWYGLASEAGTFILHTLNVCCCWQGGRNARVVGEGVGGSWSTILPQFLLQFLSPWLFD